MWFDTRLRRAWLFWSLAAAVSALARVSPLIVSVLPAEAAASAARGLAKMAGIAGVITSFPDQLAALLWKAGGPGAVWAANWLIPWLGWTLLLSLLCLAALTARRWIRGGALRLGVMALMSVTLLAVMASGIHDTVRVLRERVATNIGLSYPLDLLRAPQWESRPAFSNPSGLIFQLLWAPETVDTGTSFSDRAAFCLHPEKWRQAARRNGWRTVLLIGPRAEYQPLLEHLLPSPDWRLAKVGNHGFLFVKEIGEDAPAPAMEEIREPSSPEQAVRLAQLAARFNTLRWHEPSRRFLVRALETAPGHPDVLSYAADIAAENKRWHDALKYSDRILQGRPADVHARLVRVLALEETGRGDEALDALEKLRASLPEDSYILFLHARLCREAHDYRRETESLQQLVRLAELRSQPAAHYQIYLGQSLAKQGFARQALEQFQAAADSGQLSPAQAAEVRETMQAVRSQMPREGP